jgi:uncharacterized repeat protein (TIGR02543 family)
MKLIRVIVVSAILLTFLGCPVENTNARVIYENGQSTGGNVPTDSTSYDSGDTITVLDNSGNLIRTGFTFNGWNTQLDGNGTSYVAGDTFTIGSQNVTLYPQFSSINKVKDIALGSSFT